MSRRNILGIILFVLGAGLLAARAFNFYVNDWLALIGGISIGAGILLLVIQRQPPQNFERVAANAPTGDAARAVINLKHAAGYLNLSAGAGAGNLFQGIFDGGVEQKIARADGQLQLELRTPDAIRANAAALDPRRLTWQLQLVSNLPLEVLYEGGAAQAEMNFSNLDLQNLELDAGASACDVQLPMPRATLRVIIRASAAPIHVRVPPNAAALIRSALGAHAPQIDTARFSECGFGIFQSENYANAKERIEITVQDGANAVTIR